MRLLNFGLTILLALAAQAELVLHLEGEDHARAGGPGKLRVIERDGAFGGKVLSYWDAHDTWAEWDLEVDVAATYALSFRYAAVAETARRFEINGKAPDGFSPSLTFPPTGSYALFAMHTVTAEDGTPRLLDLAAAKQVLRLTNEASTGLALDAILFHPPGLRFNDQPLTAAEAELWQERLPGAPLAAEAGTGRLALATVEARFADEGPGFLAVAGTLFSLPEAKGDAACFRTANLLVHRNVHGGLYRFTITDGQAAYRVLAYGAGGAAEAPLTPRVYRQNGRLHWPATWRSSGGTTFVPALGRAGDSSLEWRLGTVHITAVPAMTPEPSEASRHTPGLRFVETARVTALKIAPAAWRDPGLEVIVQSEGASSDIVRSTARRLPGIAAFHQYADFEMRFVWDGERLAGCNLTDLASGQTVSLLDRRMMVRPE